MDEILASVKTAKLAKKKKFDWNCHLYYGPDGEYYGHPRNVGSNTNSEFPNFICSAPTQSHLQKWLREKHHLVVEPCFNESLYRRLHERAHNKKSLNYHWTIITNTDDPEHIYNKFYSDDTFETYEEALEVGINKALKMIS